MNINSLNRCNANLSTTDNLLITSFRLQNHSPRREIQYAWRYKMLKKWHFSHMMINQYLSHLNRADRVAYHDQGKPGKEKPRCSSDLHIPIAMNQVRRKFWV